MKAKLVIGLTVFIMTIAGAACSKNDLGEQASPSASAIEEAGSRSENASPETEDKEPGLAETVAEYHKISAVEAQERIKGNDPFILLDVRTEEEFREKRIDGAVLIPDFELKERAETELPNKEALILIYCRSGRRSADAANMLVAAGYTNVYDFGGIIDWPYDTISGES